LVFYDKVWVTDSWAPNGQERFVSGGPSVNNSLPVCGLTGYIVKYVPSIDRIVYFRTSSYISIVARDTLMTVLWLTQPASIPYPFYGEVDNLNNNWYICLGMTTSFVRRLDLDSSTVSGTLAFLLDSPILDSVPVAPGNVPWVSKPMNLGLFQYVVAINSEANQNLPVTPTNLYFLSKGTMLVES